MCYAVGDVGFHDETRLPQHLLHRVGAVEGGAVAMSYRRPWNWTSPRAGIAAGPGISPRTTIGDAHTSGRFPDQPSWQ